MAHSQYDACLIDSGNCCTPSVRACITRSHVRVVRSSPALGSYPDDVLGGILDVAGLAVHAVLRVDLQLVGALGVFHELVYAGGAIAALGTCVFREIDLHRDARVLESE